MKPLSFLVLVLFFADLVFDSVLGKLGTAPERYLTKGLFMPLLLTFFILEVKHSATESNIKYIRFIALAMVLSFIADLVFVNLTQKLNFAIGLGIYALAYGCYSLFLYKKKPFIQKNEVFLFFAALLIIGYMVLINYLFWSKMYYQNLIAPVIFYCVFAGFILLCAVNTTLSKRISRTAIIFFIPGAACFVASGSMLGFNRFELPKPLPDYYTTITYCIGHF